MLTDVCRLVGCDEGSTRLLVTAVIGFDVLLGLFLTRLVRLRRRRPPLQEEGQPKAIPKTSRRPPRRHEAVLIDINNIRGGLRFDRDVDEMVAGLVRWAADEPDGPLVVLEVDHGPQAKTYALAGTRVLICFAGPRMEADDTIVCGVHFFAQRGRRVLVASSDSNLRTRCAAAAAAPPQDGVATPKKSNPRLDFLHRTSFSDLPASGTRRGGALENLLLGATPLTAKAAAAVRVARREKAGKKTELTPMRIEQAEVLFCRLEAAAAGAGSVPGRGLASVPGMGAVVEAADDRHAHGAWLNEPVGLDALRRRLKAEMQAYWDSKLFD